MLRGLVLRFLPFVCALPLFAGCWGTENGEADTSTPTEEVGSVELGAHAGGAPNANPECVTDADCGGPVGCGTCGPDLHCIFNDGVACGDQTDSECDNPNTCDAGVCEDNFEAADDPCGSNTDNFCTAPDTCDGNGVCQANNLNEGDICGDTNNDDCDNADRCENGVCEDNLEPVGHACGNQNESECNHANTCNGSGVCLSNREPAGTPCGDKVTYDDCNQGDTCDGNGACQNNELNSGDPCGDQTDTECDAADTCDGNHVCQANIANAGDFCGDSADTTCTDRDTCDGAGTCLVNNALDGINCGNGPATCTDQDTCLGGVCQANDTAAGTACGNPTDTECDNPDQCDGNGTCLTRREPSGTSCDDFIGCTLNTECDGAGNCDHLPSAGDDGACPKGDMEVCASWECNPGACNGNPDCVDGCEPTFFGSTQVCNLDKGACDVEERCNGSQPTCPTDVGEGASHVCQAATCANGVAKLQVACGVSLDVCPVVADVDCLGYQCDDAGIDCRTDCGSSTDCMPTHYCDSGVCNPRINPGDSCTDDSECSPSNPYCVDGVCCNAKCEGQCESCNQPTSPGVCTVNPDGSQPSGDREECAGDGGACDGYCDGVGRLTCTYPGSNTDCQGPSCDPQTNTATEAAVCDGAGACAVPEPVECAPYVCGATQCLGDCAADSDCEATAYCRAGVCTPKVDDGETCTRAGQCTSGFCVDDVCCDTRCEGQCEACNVAGNAGECNAVSGDPVGDRAGCSGSGDCGGICDGTLRTACTYPGAEQECRAAACDSGTATLAAQCDGSGNCPAAQTVDCPQDCEGSICGGDGCTIDTNCPQGQHCTAGVCVPTEGPGGQCSDGADCASGFCADGVCCDSACLGQCEACDVAGNEGTCSPVPEGDVPHGTRPTCSSDGSVCGGSCDGSTRDGCSYPVGDVCRAGSCDQTGSGAVAVVEGICQGDGRCPVEQSQSCGQYDCTADGELCNGDCVDDANACSASEYCSAGVCVSKQPDGTPCGGDAECQSDFCVDGVCCDTACDGQCEACDVAGDVGACTAVSGSTHGGRAACQGAGPCGATCDGSSRDSCEFPGATTSCGPAFCANGARSDGQLCDGAGTCTQGQVEQCLSQTCDGTACGTSCETDADCTGENRCRDGVCEPDPLIDAVDEGSCGCRVPGRPADGGLLLLAGLFASSLLARRRQRASVSRS